MIWDTGEDSDDRIRMSHYFLFRPPRKKNADSVG